MRDAIAVGVGVGVGGIKLVVECETCFKLNRWDFLVVCAI
jgi:hypothetical protein